MISILKNQALTKASIAPVPLSFLSDTARCAAKLLFSFEGLALGREVAAIEPGVGEAAQYGSIDG
jgi:hypothetical protein